MYALRSILISCLAGVTALHGAAAAQPPVPAATAPPPLDINAATEWELQSLPGIGPAKARAILEVRQRMGRFRQVEDILRVRGIGRATLRRLRPLLTVEGRMNGSGASASERSAQKQARRSP